MNEPDETQPTQADEGNRPVVPSKASSVHDTPVARQQPEFGQYAKRPYGAMDSQFPDDYDPYLFGRPDPAPETPTAQAPAQGAAQPSPRQPDGNGQQWQSGMPQMPYRIEPIDPDDPQRNPFYGRWDGWAVISFLMALFIPCPILPAVLGAISMRRTKVLHMKGRGLAIAAVAINVLYSLVVFYCMAKGITMDQLLGQMAQWAGLPDPSASPSSSPSTSTPGTTPTPSASGDGALSA
ncbi:hypothetical protein BCUN_0937 [Bifidobacterium cuniculi]|uniref:DUF4190 domain-containing protein n=2 Tax=Bifidobacterium cuniculi TaxID=1688 RepID=A0A087AQB1_9BIFI|nr:hypothetical protein BCUN_0937 [Bifidobacterium cuniculi]